MAVLEGEDAGDLVDVGEVVDGPGGEEIGGGDGAEDGVDALELELSGGEVEGGQFVEAVGAGGGEGVEEVGEGVGLAEGDVAEAVEGREGAGGG